MKSTKMLATVRHAELYITTNLEPPDILSQVN